MILPNAHLAEIDPAKVQDYLLSPSHPIGRFKAVFFMRLGYSASQWERLRSDLLLIARTSEATPGQESPYGQKYETRATLTGPNGPSAEIVAVWIVKTGDLIPRFVTAFPG